MPSGRSWRKRASNRPTTRQNGRCVRRCSGAKGGMAPRAMAGAALSSACSRSAQPVSSMSAPCSRISSPQLRRIGRISLPRNCSLPEGPERIRNERFEYQDVTYLLALGEEIIIIEHVPCASQSRHGRTLKHAPTTSECLDSCIHRSGHRRRLLTPRPVGHVPAFRHANPRSCG